MDSNIEINEEKKELKLSKSKITFINIKSIYFLQKIFDYLKMPKSLEIIKYNKNIQNRLNISINNYKIYSEEYSSIEIELTPMKNEYGRFINFSNKKDYYHIYFNDNKDEIKRNYLSKDDKVDKIKIIIDYQVISFENLFKDCEYIEAINFKKFYRNNIKYMSDMFFGCSSLKYLNLSNFNTENVTNMNCMFYGCSLLKELNLSKFNTNNVNNMAGLFYKCSSLNELILLNFKTDNVTNMSYMFYECSSLKELDLSNFNIFKLSSMNYMFYKCTSLINLKLPIFNTENKFEKFRMFSGCCEELKMKINQQIKNLSEDAFYD